MLCTFPSVVTKAEPWFHGREERRAGHTSALHSFCEVSTSLKQHRQRYAFDSPCVFTVSMDFKTIGTSFPLPHPFVECLLCVGCQSVGDHVSGQPGVTYLRGTWAQVREGSEGLSGGDFWYMLSTFDRSLSSMNLKSNSCFFHTSHSSLPTLAESVVQSCCSVNWLLNFTLMQTGKLYWASMDF